VHWGDELDIFQTFIVLLHETASSDRTPAADLSPPILCLRATLHVFRRSDLTIEKSSTAVNQSRFGLAMKPEATVTEAASNERDNFMVDMLQTFEL
jgi:hypothetical protein